MSISLYRQYRPLKFSEVAGQPAAVSVIVKSLRQERVGHAYLFSGPRGCGKTTVARLLAKALNCLAPAEGYEPCCECKNCLAVTAGESLDVIEIDGASNNSVDEVRELKSHVTLAPFSSKYKIYIIDEVHMLSISAFNALLKTLEEPPAYVVFILATTEAHKVPVTIRSRCQHIPFHRIETRKIYDRLAEVCERESLVFQPEALREIARQADGALRDGLSMLEQVAGTGGEGISLADVEAVLGQGGRSALERWVAGWRVGKMETFSDLERMLAGGGSPQRFLEELFSLCRDLWLAARWRGLPETLDVSLQEKEYLEKEAPLWKPAQLESLMRFLAELLPQARMGLRTDVLTGLLMTQIIRLTEGGSAEEAREAPKTRKISEARKTPPDQRVQPVGTVETVETEKQIPAAPVAQEPAGKGEPVAEEIWDAALTLIHDKEFSLYCGLLDARPSEDGERLILDIPSRYCYEMLRLDRNRATLKKALSEIHPGPVILRHEDQTASCDITRVRSKNVGAANRQIAQISEESPENGGEGKSGEARADGDAGQTPFAGLVRGVQRVLSGEVILVRRGAEEENDEAVAPEEQE